MRSLADSGLKAVWVAFKSCRGERSEAVPRQATSRAKCALGELAHAGVLTSEPASSESSPAVFITMVIVWLMSGEAGALTRAI